MQALRLSHKSSGPGVLSGLVFFCLVPVLYAAGDDSLFKFIPHQAASVNKRVVTKSRLLAELLKKHSRDYYSSLPADSLKSLVRTVLDAVIDRCLLDEAIETARISSGPEEAKDWFYATCKKMTPLQLELFRKKLARENLTFEDYADRIAADESNVYKLRLEKLIAKNFPGKTVISSDEIERYYREHQSRFQVPASVNISSIFISFASEKKRLGPQTDVEKAKKSAWNRISSIRDRLATHPGDFPLLAEKYNDLPAGPGGMIGTFCRGNILDPGLEQTAFRLVPGSISGIIDSSDGLRLIRVNRRIPEGYSSLSDVSGFIEEELHNTRISRLTEVLLMKLRRKAMIMFFF